jgi:putative membrane protein
MTRFKLTVVTAAMTAAWCAAPVGQTIAQTPAQTNAGSQGKATQAQASKATSELKREERKFLETAAQHNMAEVEVGKLAQSKAANPDAKKFGQQMVDDHGKAYDEVVQLAKAKSISLPMEPDRGHKREAQRLEKLSGADFDRQFMDAMVKDHEKDVKEFRKMSKDAKDPDVKAWAAKTLPTLESHLEMARKVAANTSGAKQHKSQ